METVFLKCGQECKLIKKMDGGFLVEPFWMYQEISDCGDWRADVGEPKFVTKIFKSAPKKKLEAKFLELTEKVQEANKVLGEVNKDLQNKRFDLENTKRQTTDLEKLFINKAEFRDAKRITIFGRNDYNPTDVALKSLSSFRLTMETTFDKDNSERWWVQKFEGEHWGYTNAVDVILFDKTDEEILEFAKERVRLNITDYDKQGYSLLSIDDLYLSPEALKFKRGLEKIRKVQQLKHWTTQKNKAQEEINKLK